MTLQQAYDKFGGDYKLALTRLPGDAFVSRFAKKFLDDKSFLQLSDALFSGDSEAAFRAAHTLKGVAANLSFAVLYEKSETITEALRGADDVSAALPLFPEVKEAYDNTVSVLKEFFGM